MVKWLTTGNDDRPILNVYSSRPLRGLPSRVRAGRERALDDPRTRKRMGEVASARAAPSSRRQVKTVATWLPVPH